MKILLVSPPSSHVLNEVISLGLLSLATTLDKHGYKVTIVDANACNNLLDNEQIVTLARKLTPDAIGINLMTPFVPNCYKLVEGLKSLNSVLIAGGPHATLIPEEVLTHGFDVAVRGEGEVTIIELLETIKAGGLLHGVRGICFKDEKGGIVKNADRPLIEDLNSLPYPDYGLIDLSNYSAGRSNNIKIFSMLTSRSCPFRCIYCANAQLFRGKYRMRSAENIFREIMGLKERYDVKYIRFIDDTLTVDKQRVHKLMDLMKSAKELRDLKWECDSRVDCVDEDLLRSMKDAGCEAIIYGIESYDAESLRLMKKGINIQQIDKAVAATKKAGMFMNINTIFGFKWETPAHIKNTLKLLDIDYNNCQYPNGIPIPWPGTEQYERYHEALNFSHWWLNEENFPEYYLVNRQKPFYGPRFIGIDNITRTSRNMRLWEMDKDMQQAVYRAMFKLNKRSLTNVHGMKKGIILYLLSRISLILFNIHPKVEYVFFAFLKRLRRSLPGRVMGQKR